MIKTVVAKRVGLVGDSISTFPFLYFLAKNHRVKVCGEFCPDVIGLLTVNIDFEIGDTTPELIRSADHVLEPTLALEYGIKEKLHMWDTHFVYNDFDIDTVQIPHITTNMDFTAPHYNLVVSPFSRSDINNNKKWPDENWIRVLENAKNKSKLVIGNEKYDNLDLYRPYADVLGNGSLIHIAGIIHKCGLFASIENGMGHLAHLVRKTRHYMLIPPVAVPYYFICNRYSNLFVLGNPSSIEWTSVSKDINYLLEH